MIEVDIWIRGNQHAATHRITSLPSDPALWTEDEARQLLEEMLLALNRDMNPGSDPPPITLRGFNWIVSTDPSGGVLVHLETQSGTASAGPLAIAERALSDLITRAMTSQGSVKVH